MGVVSVSDDTLVFVQRCQHCAHYSITASLSAALLDVVHCLQTVPLPCTSEDAVVICTCIMELASKADVEFRATTRAPPDPVSRHTRVVLQYLFQQSTDSALTLDRIARSRGVSSTRLCRAFVADVGIGFSKCLGALRLIHACCLMGSRQLTIKEIAFHSGFASKSDFSRAFRRWFHMCPTTFRTNCCAG
jgi:AraC-like DNA-binding protein